MNNILLYQIAYSEKTLEMVEPGYQILNNITNLRPDWYEYWPIRNYILQTKINDNYFYGFFSPKFKIKTNISYEEVYKIIQNNMSNYDIILFSPQYDMGAFFLNTLEQGDLFDEGFEDSMKKFLIEIDYNIDPRKLIMDSTNIIFSNYFVASGKFIKYWFKWTEALFDICENSDHNLNSEFCIKTSYPGNVQRKVFLLERIVSIILASQKKWRVYSHNPISKAWSSLPTNKYVNEAIISDALKIAYNQTNQDYFLKVFSDLRNKLFYPKKPNNFYRN